MSTNVGSATGYLDLDISGFLAGLQSAQAQANTQTKNMATTIGNNISGMGEKIASVGTTLTKTVTVPLAGIGVVGLKTAMNFEKGMSEVRAISGATGKDFDALKEKAIDLGATTAFSAGEVATAMTEMAKAGWSTQQILDGMGGVLDAAAASGEDLGVVATIVADAITGFGMAASDSTRVADLLTQAANSGTIGITELGETFKYVAPIAGSMGLSIDDVTTAVAAMSMAGIKGSQAGTSLRTMLTNLVNPTGQAVKAIEALGISATNSDGSMKSLDEIVSMLRTSFDDLTESEKSQYAAMLAGQEGMSGLLALLNLTEEEYNAIAASMDNASGVAQETAEVMQDNLQSKVEQLVGSLESLAIKLGDLVIPYVRQFVEWLTTLVDKFTNLDEETQKSILKFAGIAIAAGPVLTVFGKLVSGVGSTITAFGKIPGAINTLSGGFTKLVTSTKNVFEGFKLAKAGFTALGSSASPLGAALAGITGPMIAIVAAIALVIAAFVSLWKNNEEFRNKIIAIWNQVKATFEKLTSGIVDRLNGLGFDFKNIGEVLKAIWEGFCNFLAPIFEGVFQYIADTFDFIVNQILTVLDIFIAIFKGDWKGAWEGIKTYFLNIWNYIVDWFKNVGNVLVGFLDMICGLFGTTWEDTWTSIKDFFVNIWNSIVSWFKTALSDIATFFVNVWTSISTFFSNLWNGIITFLSNAWETIKNVVQVGIMFIASLLDAAFQIITLPFRFIWENCKEYVFAAWEWIKTAVSTALNAISAFIEKVWNGIKAFLEPILNAIKTFVVNVWDSIADGISVALDAISTFVENTWNGIKEFFEPILNGIKEFAINAWDSITTGISNALNAVWNFITSVWNTITSFVTNTWSNIKNTAVSIWNGIKEAISGPINTAKNTISTVVDAIKNTISNGFTAAKNTVTSIFDSIKNKISDVMESAKTTVSNAIENLKSYFKFEWSLPKLKMPHFRISGSFSLNPPSVPTFSVEWYKKAMSGGMILNGATIFGMDSAGNLLGGGEAGSETVVGTESLLKMIRSAVLDAIAPMVEATYQLTKVSHELGYITNNAFARQTQVFEQIMRGRVEGEPGSGDTFIFNSPNPIDEIEAAYQMKKAKRELAEGF